MGELVAFFGLALLDSINPSALALTLYLVTTGSGPGRVLTYIAAVFVTYFTVGLSLLLGLSSLLGAFGGVFESAAAYGVQALVGAAMLVYSFVPKERGAQGGEVQGDAVKTRPPRSQRLAAMFLLGVTVTAAEFPTAFPYLGAIGILNGRGLSPLGWLPLLLTYNLIFVLPPLLLFGAYRVLGERYRGWFARYEKRLQHEVRETMLWIVGIVGFLLLADALRYFEFFGLVSGPDLTPSTAMWLRVVAAGHN